MNLAELSDDDLLRLYYQLENEVSFNNNMQMAMKILLNAGYGAVGNASFLYYRVENAEAITMAGQLINKWTCHRLTNLLRHISGNTDRRYVIAGDTDSAYVNIDDIVDIMIPNWKDKDIHYVVDKIDEFIKLVVDPQVKTYCEDLVQYLQAYKNKMVWEREIIAQSIILVAKKNYCASVWDSEGVRYRDHPKYKIVGFASKKSSTPKWSRQWLEEMYRIALDKDQSTLQQRFHEVEKEFYQLPVSEISIPTGVNGLEKFYDEDQVYKKGAPAHVKAALFHNKLLKDLNLRHLNPIASASKIRYVQLKEPNPLRADSIAFDEELPTEFGLDEYVDRQGIFNKAFVDPLTIVLNSINWTTEETITLESFFG